MSVRNDIKELLHKEGYKLESQGRHDTWVKGEHKMSISCSPSDRRALYRVRSEIRRFKRNHKT